MIHAKSFKAKLHPRECKSFIVEHTKVLEAFDIANITSAKTDWAFVNGSVIVTFRNEDKEMLAGSRIQVANGEIPLPIEDAVGDMDENIYSVIKKHSEEGGTAEFCGLWNTRKAAKMGLGSLFLVKTLMAVVGQMGFKSMFALCAPGTIKTAKRVGFLVEENLGENGTFYYPKLDLLATAMKLSDVNTLEHAGEEEKRDIFELRTNPNQQRMELLRGVEIDVQYDLLLT